MLQKIILISQIVISISLITSILLQAKGVGLSATFGGAGGFYRSRRGVEKILLYLSIILVFLFITVSILGIIFT
jgi:protein translocase SecG subunit